MKAILVINHMPSRCEECPCSSIDYETDGEMMFTCDAIPFGYLELSEENMTDKKPSWCPLKPMPLKKKFSGKILKVARLMKGYTLQKVGDMIGKSKVSVKRYEDGVVKPKGKTLERLCDALGIGTIATEEYVNGWNACLAEITGVKNED